MIIELHTGRPPAITDTDRLDRLHATAEGGLEGVDLGDFCRIADPDHIWVSIAALRDAADDPAGFEKMIAYAVSNGWLDEAGTHVRAHLEPT